MKTAIALAIIICIAAFLRLWHLDGVPITPNWDEVAIGYNSYSLLLTGMDEYAEKYPFVLRSFNDYKPALYLYVLIPFIKFLGLSVMTLRLPSALFGIASVVGTFYLTWELLRLRGINGTNFKVISLISALLLAISPWHIQFSRAAFEANLALTFCIFGLLFFLLSLKRPTFLILSAIFYGFSIHAYHSTRLFVPLFVIGLLFIFRNHFLKNPKRLIVPALVMFLFVLPFVFFLIQNKGYQIFGRATQTSVFASNQPQGLESIYRIGSGYISHFSPNWLFLTGDNDRHHAPSTGLLYLWELPFLIAGVIYLLKHKSRFRTVLLLWILLSPLPAAFTTEVPHAIRTLIFLPAFQIIVVLGIMEVVKILKKLPLRYVLATSTIYFVFSLFIIFQYFHLYFFQMNHEFSRFWQFGYGDVVSFALQNKEKYKKVVVSHNLEQPYIFFLFYLKYNPSKYIEEGGTKDGVAKAFDKYEFRSINWKSENHDGSTLYVLSPNDERSGVVHTIRYFDGSEAFILSE